MQRAFIIGVPILLVLLVVLGGSVGPAVRPVGEEDGVFPYRFDRGGLRYADILTLGDGSKHLGKAMEWADQVLLFDADGRPAVFDVADVERFEFRRAARHKVRPELPDLTVAYIERLPRDPSWQGHVAIKDGVPVADFELDRSSWHPAPGAPVTFRAHVLNAGGTDSAAVPWRISVDDAELKGGNLPALKPGAEQVVEAAWPWQEGRHALRVEVDAGGSSPEIVRWNNTLTEPTDALAVAVVVSAERRRTLGGVANIVDSFCFEDWARYQLAALNGLFAASRHPSSPQGILERVRCDRIIVAEDADDPQRRSAWESPLHRDGKPDGPAEYAALWVSGIADGGAAPEYQALEIDWPALQDLARQLGLVDLTKTDTTIEQCLALDQFGRYAQRQYLFPLRRTMMYAAGGFAFDERSTAFLNHVRGRPRGFSGDFLYQLPEKIAVEVRSNSGAPLADVQVDVFQLAAEGEFAGTIAGAGRGEPLYSATTGPDGRLTLVHLPAPAHQTPGGYALRPNPFGKIAADGSNGLLLLRLRLGGAEEFHFLSLLDCNLACLRGQNQEYVRELATRLAPPDSPPAPLYVAARMEDRTAPKPPLHMRWRMPPEADFSTLEEFRFYRRTSFGGDDVRSWTLYSIVGRDGGRFTQFEVDGTYFEEFRSDVPYSLDTFYAVSAVDREGRESRLSAPAYLAYDKDSLKLTMDLEAAYITVTGDGPCQMLRWDGTAGTQPYGVRARAFPGYVPGFWGIAMAADGRLIVTDPINHVLAFYDRGDLVEVVPNRTRWPGFPSDEPGEFYAPADVAVDESGNIYVADFGNDRVQVLDAHGRFKTLVDEGFRWDGPQAVGFSNGRLCVTDADGARCRVYDCRHREGEAPAEPIFVCQLPELREADRAVVNKSGKVFVGGRDVKTGSAGILSYIPEGEGAKFDTVGTEGNMGRFHRPRGLYAYRGGDQDILYFVNEFPFDVRMYKME